MPRLVDSFEQFFNASGDPLVSGLIDFYESGSNTVRKTTYADSSEKIPNSNPLVLNGDGRCPNVFGSGSYRAVLRTSAGVQLLSRDPVGGTSALVFGADWNSVQIYSSSDVVRDDGRYWISNINNNIGNQPSLDSGASWTNIFLDAENIFSLLSVESYADMDAMPPLPTGAAITLTDVGISDVWVVDEGSHTVDSVKIRVWGNATGTQYLRRLNNGIEWESWGDAATTRNGGVMTGPLIVDTDLDIGLGFDPALDNIAIGKNALINSSLASTLNIAIGRGALQFARTSGGAEDGANVAVGRSSMQDLTTGYFNTSVGTTAGQSFTTAYNCTAIGRGAMAERAQGYDNVGVGREALYGEIGTPATSHTGFGNSAVGVSALHDVIGGDRNTAMGRSAFDKLTSGNDNVGFGYSAGNAVTTGSGNVIIGGYSGNSGGLDVRTASNTITFCDGPGTIRMNFDSSGNGYIGKVAAALGTVGHEFRSNGSVYHTTDGNDVMFINRLTDDGSLIRFYRDGALQGNISVSGTTVTYGGGHLARFTQLLDNSRPASLLKGTVLSNLDDMLDRPENEQLNYNKISDIEGDKNVSGVFVSWADSDDENNLFYAGMTGDMVIRVAAGVEVEKGDLLISAGDGTAKAQGDDFVRSSTIAKVISKTHLSVHSDGSKLIPCVLMAC